MSTIIHTTTTPEPDETREEVEVKLPTRARLSPSYRGQRFRPHGTDAIGVIRSWSKRTIQFHYLHAPDVPYSIERHEFTERFAEWLPRPEAPKPIRPLAKVARVLAPRPSVQEAA